MKIQSNKFVLSWVDLQVAPLELKPSYTLNMGQCFNWKKIVGPNEDENWIGVINRTPYLIKQAHETTLYLNLQNKERNLNDSLIRDYFQLGINMQHLGEEFSNSCVRFSSLYRYLQGIRILRQDPWECLISFICSSNNNIKRISQMLAKLREKYGVYIGKLNSFDGIFEWNSEGNRAELSLSSSYCCDSGKEDVTNSPPRLKSIPTTFQTTPKQKQLINSQSIAGDSQPEVMTPHSRGGNDDLVEVDSKANESIVVLYAFPTVESIASATEADLRSIGMGYRAKYLIRTAQMVRDMGGEQWLHSLRLKSREEVQNELLKLPGEYSVVMMTGL